MGRSLEAEEQFRRALEADPGSVPAALGWARALDGRGHRREAVEVLRVMSRRRLGREILSVAQGFCDLERRDLALEILRGHEESVEVDEAEVDEMVVRVATEAGRFPEALAAARRLRGVGRAEGESLVRALEGIVAEADAVSHGETQSGLRGALRRVGR